MSDELFEKAAPGLFIGGLISIIALTGGSPISSGWIWGSMLSGLVTSCLVKHIARQDLERSINEGPLLINEEWQPKLMSMEERLVADVYENWGGFGPDEEDEEPLDDDDEKSTPKM